MTTRRFGFVLLPDFALLPLSCMVDTLADANYVSERPLYEWYSLSMEGTEVMAANGLRLAADYEIADAPSFDSVVVCSAFDAHLHRSRRMSRWLNRLVESGARVGAIATGSWQLAYAGLLDGRRCTIHWEDLPSFRETFPALRVSDAIFEIDGPVFTCSGGTGAIDLFLHFVAEDFGADIATQVAQQIMYQNIRSGDEHQPVDASALLRVHHQGVAKATEMMRKAMESPVSIEQIAAASDMSLRQLERQFARLFGRTPQDFYRDLRLDRARNLIRLTNLSMSEIATACGFSSASYLARCHRRRFGRSPSAERGRAATRQESDRLHNVTSRRAHVGKEVGSQRNGEPPRASFRFDTT